MGHDIWGKPLLILGLIFLLGGIQLITIGILAEISVRTYFESQNKKTYTVRKCIYVKTGSEAFVGDHRLMVNAQHELKTNYTKKNS